MNLHNAFVLALPLALVAGCATPPSAVDPGASDAPLGGADSMAGEDALTAPSACRSANLFVKYGFMADVRSAFGLSMSAGDEWRDVRLGKVFGSTMSYGGESVSVRVGAGASSLGGIFSGSGTDGVLSFEFGAYHGAADRAVALQVFNAMTAVREVRVVSGEITTRTRTSPGGRLSCQHASYGTSGGPQVSCTIRDIFSSNLSLLDASMCAWTYP